MDLSDLENDGKAQSAARHTAGFIRCTPVETVKNMFNFILRDSGTVVYDMTFSHVFGCQTQFYKNIPVFLPVFVGIIDQVADGALKQKVISLNADTFRALSGISLSKEGLKEFSARLGIK